MTANLEMDAEQIRRDIVTMIHHAGSGHSGGSLSAVEILTCLYGAVMRMIRGIPKIPAVTVLFSAKAMLLRHCMQCCHIMDIFRRRN